MASSARPASAGGRRPQLGSNQVQSDRRSCTRSNGQCTVASNSRLVIPIGGQTAGTTGPRGQDDADGTQGLSCSPWHGVRAWMARWSSQELHFTSSVVAGLVRPSVPVSHHLLLLPAAGVPAELVDEPPAIHPLKDLPLVVVPEGDGWSEVPGRGRPAQCPQVTCPLGSGPGEMGLNHVLHGRSPGSLTRPCRGHLALPGTLHGAVWSRVWRKP